MRGFKTALTHAAPAILVIAACLAAPAFAGDVPVEVQRIWALEGDLIGAENHGALSFTVLDAYGDAAKAAEDWQILDEKSGSGVLQWRQTFDSGYRAGLRAAGGSGAGGVDGQLAAWGAKPGLVHWGLTYRRANHYYDTDSEMRLPAFRSPPAPPELDPAPNLEWKALGATAGLHAGRHLDLRVSFDDFRREGDKSSLLREVGALGAVGSETPDRKVFDTATSRVRVAAAYVSGSLDSDAEFVLRASDGNRALGERQQHVDDQQAWRLNWNAGYGLGGGLRVFGGLHLASLKDEGGEIRSETTVRDGEVTTTQGRLGLAARLGRATLVSLTGLAGEQEAELAVADASGILTAVDRSTSRSGLQAAVTHTGLADTRLQLRYRYRQDELEEFTAEGDVVGGPAMSAVQGVDRTATRHDATFKARRRLSRRAQLVLHGAWEKSEVEETVAGDELQYRLGDRTRDRLCADLGLRLRPAARWRLDAGYRLTGQTFERASMPGLETTWSASQARLNLNWFAHDRVSFYGMLAYGREELELSGDPVANGTLGAVGYDGATLRFAPGATVQLTPCLQLEASYEGVRFQDEADESPALAAVEADSDRTLLRLRWSAPRELTVTGTYRRHEFDENRWDDYIHDLYTLTVSRMF